MKKFAMTPLLLLAFSAMSRPVSSPQDNVRLETIVRTDTVVQTDTIITTKKVKRTEVIQRMEEVYYADSVSLKAGQPSRKTVTLSKTPVAAQPGTVPSAATVFGLPGHSAVPATAPVSESVELKEFAETALPPRPGGDYLWVPDSIRQQVALLLQGTGKVLTESQVAEIRRQTQSQKGEIDMQGGEFDPDERVTFRGDTVNMVLKSRNLGRFDRGLFNYLYIPKGIWSIGVTASYGEFSTEDMEILDLMSDIDLSGHIFAIRPYFSYFIGNNRAVGMRLGYTSGKANIGSFNVDIDEDMNFNLHDISYRSEKYTAAVTYSQYFGITRRGRFSIFNDVELAFSSGNSDFNRPYGGKIKNTHTNTMEVALNFSPGLSVYIMDPVTFNLSFGVFGVSLRNEKQTVDGEDMGSRFTSGANFRFNIFNISFGVAVNL